MPPPRPKLRTGEPVWLPPRVAHRAPRYPRLTGVHRADVAIVGGGITGAIAALRFAEAGVDAVVLEADRIGARQHRGEQRAAAPGAGRATVGAERALRRGDGEAHLAAEPRRRARSDRAARAAVHAGRAHPPRHHLLHDRRRRGRAAAPRVRGPVPRRLRRDVADAAGAAGRRGHPGPRRHPDARQRALRSVPRLRGRDARGGTRRARGCSSDRPVRRIESRGRGGVAVGSAPAAASSRRGRW